MQILSLDIGKFKSVGCLFETGDGTYSFRDVKTLPAQIRELIEKERPERVVFEVGTEAGWIADICRELDVEFEAVNPATLMHCMHRRRAKSDRKDALDLATASALKKTRGVHVPTKEIRARRALIEQRARAVERGTALRNEIRSIFQQSGIPLPAAGRAWTLEGIMTLRERAAKMEEVHQRRFQIALDALGATEAEVASLETMLDAIAKTDPRIALLRTVPGVGARGAETVVAWIDDPTRFRNGRQVGCYAGFTPRPNQSGGTDRSGAISKAGPPRLRTMLVEVAWMSLRWNEWAREVFRRVCRGLKDRRKRAIVALARRLFIRLWAMLRDGKPWDPDHVTPKMAAAAMR
jgi:transposase